MMKRGNISVKVCDICHVDTYLSDIFFMILLPCGGSEVKIRLDVSNMTFENQCHCVSLSSECCCLFYFQGKGEMSTYWLTDVHRSPFGSSDANSNVSPLSSSSFGMVCDMLQDGGSLMRALGMEYSTKSLSASELRNLTQCPMNSKPISMSVSNDRPPDFNTFKNFIGRRKTEICIDEMTEKDKSEVNLQSQA